MTYINKEVCDDDFPNCHSYGGEITWYCHKTNALASFIPQLWLLN